jgi:hypothetical protein
MIGRSFNSTPVRPSVWLLCLALGGCGGSPAASTSETPLTPGDSAGVDSTPPPADSVLPPPDSAPPSPSDTTPPPDSGVTVIPAPPPTHVGTPFGPYHLPPRLYGRDFSGAFLAAWPPRLLEDLEAARWGSARILISMAGSEISFLGKDGHFSLEAWKRRIDRFRGIDFSSYIADGTIIGHYIMDEPHDPTNWGGKTVSRADIDEMARYSKEIWPTMPTVIRTTPEFLKGYTYKYLDAAWAQYTVRFGSIDEFVKINVQGAEAAGLALVGGLNVINGGSKESGIPGRSFGKYGMSAAEIKQYGGPLLAQTCAFFMWEYDSKYFSRPDIKAALEELGKMARSHPKRACRH